ncbi:MAG: AtpZ/AtpI family protein [Oscillospiraceae bacterium]|nr:AtpZ/AtpI family protein [Oscillospiraceae bacterium]
MNKNSNKSWAKAYMVAGHIAWAVLSPLVIFIGGGSWLINKLGWDYRLIIIFVLVGLIAMFTGTKSYLKQLLSMYDDGKKTTSVKPDKRDYDYNDDNYRTDNKNIKKNGVKKEHDE